MKIITTQGVKPRKLIRAFSLAAIIILMCFAFITGRVGFGVLSVVAEVDKYQVRSSLLTEAMEEVGVCAPEDAAALWAKGLEMRSAALQYAAMGQKLRKDYAHQLEESAPNWVTGESSPWVESWKVEKSEDLGQGRHAYLLNFSTATSTGPAGDYHALLTVAKENGFWRIVSLKADPELYAYTRFKPTK